MSTAAIPRIAVVAAGAMGSAVAKRLTKAGCTVYTNMDGRSDASRQRALDAGMIDVPLSDIVRKASWILSILPPRDAFSFAEKIRAETNSLIGDNGQVLTDSLVFADCNAVSPATVKRIAGLFESTSIKFIDAGIIGGPPTETYNPTFYASVDPKDEKVLDEFTALSEYGLKVAPLKGEGAGIGDASALKMSYAGISKGTTGLLTAMVLAAHASSPATADALLNELNISQSVLLNRLAKSVPPMLPKAYRWVGEMEEIGDFLGGEEANIYRGMAKLYDRIERSVSGDQGDVDVLKKFVDGAKEMIEKK